MKYYIFMIYLGYLWFFEKATLTGIKVEKGNQYLGHKYILVQLQLLWK